MRTNKASIGPLDAALALAVKGYSCIPLAPGSKAPVVKWKGYQENPPDADKLRRLFADDELNIGVLCGELIVVDCDAPEVETIVIEQCGPTPYRCRTPSGGIHLGYRAGAGASIGNRVRINGQPIDLRAAGGCAVVPPSVNAAGRTYEWDDEPPALADLPVFNAEWIGEKPTTVAPFVFDVALPERMRRARAYLSRIEGAVAGERGHDRTFRAACALTQKFGLGFDESLPLLTEWNNRCRPSWTPAELCHKLQDALQKQRT